MLLEITRKNGELTSKIRYDNWINQIIPIISDNEEFKSFILEDYVSSNKTFLEFVNISYKKINNTIIIDGKDIEFIASDNVLKGKIMLVSEKFSSLSTKTSINVPSLPQDYSIKIEKDFVEITYRNPTISTKILAFLLLRKIGIIPQPLHVESLHLALYESIPQNTKIIKFEIVKFSKYILPNKIILSIKISSDLGENYYLLTLSKGKWKITSINSQKGYVNLLHKIILKGYQKCYNFFTDLTTKWKWLDKIVNFISKIMQIKYIKNLLIFILIILGIMLIFKSMILLTIALIPVLYLLVIRIFLYINFRGKVV